MEILKKKFINFIVLLLGVVLALTPFIIAPVCPAMANGMRMSCYYSGLFATYVGIGIVLFVTGAILLAIVKSKG